MIAIDWIFKEPSYFLSLKLDGRLIGTGEFQLIQDEVQIIDIQIEPAFRRQGYGQMLLEAILHKAQDLKCVQALLEVRSKNVPALQLYKKNGFAQNGLRKNYYGDDDALLMVRFFMRGSNN